MSFDFEEKLNDSKGFESDTAFPASPSVHCDPPPPPLPISYAPRLDSLRLRHSTAVGPVNPISGKLRYPSSLDFERVVNEYSIQATRERVLEDLVEEEEEEDNEEEVQAKYRDGEPLLRPSEESAYNTFEDGGMPPPPPRQTWKVKRKRYLLGYTGRTTTRWVLTLATGILTGLFSIFIVGCTDVIQEWRSNLLDTLWRRQQTILITDARSKLDIFLLYASTNLGLALLSACLCLFLAPEAVGSGIPEIKAYLNGVRVKRFTSLRLFLVKIIATILSVSSGLAIGPEGPLVHIGAIIGASCTKLSNTLLHVLPRSWFIDRPLMSFLTLNLGHFATDSERRDLVSIGSAAGFAAAFGAPIGGLLFSMEEASSFFGQSLFLRTLAATALATFCLAVLHGDLSDYSIISLGEFKTPNDNIFLNRYEEVPLYLLVAVTGGILGGIFCRCWEFLQLYKRRMFPESKERVMWQILEVALVSLLTSFLTYVIPSMKWTCKTVDMSDDLVPSDSKSILDPWRFHPHQFDCPKGEINELATIFFGSREDAISDILSDPSQFNPNTLWIVGAVFFPLMTLTLGVSIPSGIFMPTFLIGSSLGGAAGLVFESWFGVSPSTFALLGAAALLAGIQRSTVSLCVILVEGTGQVKVLLPVIVVVVVARYIGDLISEGLYEIAMEINKYPYLHHGERRRYDIFQVRDIMSSPPITLGPRERAHTLVKLLRECQHHGFPIVDPFTKKFLGLVRRDQIVALLECGVFDEEDDESSHASLSSRGGSVPGTPTGSDWAGSIAESPMLHLAYHINDDRYDHVVNADQQNVVAVTNRAIAQDDFDMHAWLVSVQVRREQLAKEQQAYNDDDEMETTRQTIVIGEDGLPPLLKSTSRTGLTVLNNNKKDASKENLFAIVGTNVKGNVYVQWLEPSCKRKWVSLSSVMNRGTHCVTEFCPVSKALDVFTSMGLRHLVVLGGETGGQVVGILTRINLLDEYIHERTGCEIYPANK